MKEHVWYDPLTDVIFISRYYLEIFCFSDELVTVHGVKFYSWDRMTECIYLGEL